MKKRLLLGTVICALLVVLFSCSHEIGVGPGTKETVVEAKGSISGTVRYSNAEKDQNGGIMITLDKTDGLNTIAVTKSAVSRSIVDSARTQLYHQVILHKMALIHSVTLNQEHTPFTLLVPLQRKRQLKQMQL